jgi:hypothetical protein
VLGSLVCCWVTSSEVGTAHGLGRLGNQSHGGYSKPLWAITLSGKCRCGSCATFSIHPMIGVGKVTVEVSPGRRYAYHGPQHADARRLMWLFSVCILYGNANEVGVT